MILFSINLTLSDLRLCWSSVIWSISFNMAFDMKLLMSFIPFIVWFFILTVGKRFENLISASVKLCLKMHLIHTNQQSAYIAEMVELTAASSSRSGSHLLYRRIQHSSAENKVQCEHSVMPALLPGTVCHTIFSMIRTLNISGNFSKLTRLHCLFNLFTVFSIMKCPPVYL